MNTNRSPATSEATASSKFRCVGDVLAFTAGQGDHCQCADCHLFFPGGELYTYPHGNICQGCHDNRKDTGMTREAFGVSPREQDARLDLVTAFPPSRGYLGACTTIASLARHGLYGGHLGTTPSKRAAVKLIIKAHMQTNDSTGKGTKASKRIRQLRLEDVYQGVPRFEPSEDDLNRMAAEQEEVFTEGRQHRPHPVNPHD